MRIFALLGVFFIATGAVAADSAESVVAEGKLVSYDYTLTLEDGSVVETSIGRAPLSFTYGQQGAFPALEKALAGLKVNERRKIVLTPEEGYGPVVPEKFVEFPLEQIPEENRRAGDEITAESPTGQFLKVRVHEIRDDVAVVNFNHVLAGQTLTFDVKIVSID